MLLRPHFSSLETLTRKPRLNVTSRRLYHNGRTKNPIYHPNFPIGMRIDQSTGGSKLINKLRIKLAADLYDGDSTNELRPKSSRTCPWERMRLFYKLNPNYLKFCQATLSEVASECQGITMELGDVFRTYRPVERQAIYFKLIPHEFSPIYMRLRESFKEAVEDYTYNPSNCNPLVRLEWRRKPKAERTLPRENWTFGISRCLSQKLF